MDIKKNYINPNIEIISIDNDEILACSGPNSDNMLIPDMNGPNN